MKNIISKKATEMYPAGAQNSLQFRTGFVEGAKWMKKEITQEVWNMIFENISDFSEELMWEQTNSAEIADKICELIAAPVCFDELLKKLFDVYGLTLSAQQYVLVGSTVRSYLTYLKNNGRADFIIENNMLLWKAV